MRTHHKVIAVAAGVCALVYAGIRINKPVPTPNISSSITCNQYLWKFLYHPNRLKVIEPCKQVEGILINAVQEADGDWHGRLEVTDKTLINQDNVIGQHGYLVLEPICQKTPTQADAIQPCQGYNGGTFDLSKFIGKKVHVVGSFVQDSQHNKGNGGWLEIHPVMSITN